MSAAKNFGLGHSEFQVTPTLELRVTFKDSALAHPQVEAAEAAKAKAKEAK
jgi:hypothetical protein